jgi:hypothetical protein
MADLRQIEAALRAADAAGNTEDARRLAQAYAAARAQQAPPAAANDNGSTDTGIANLIADRPQPGALDRFKASRQGSVGTRILEMGQAVAHHAMSPFHGAAQFVEEGVNAAANLLPEDNAARQYVNRVAASDKEALRQRESRYQASVPTNAMTVTGAAVGEVAPFLLAAPARTLAYVGEKAASLIPRAPQLLQRMASGAAQGGLMGMVQPVTGEGDYVGQKAAQIAVGAGTGGAIPAGAASVRGLAGLVRPVVAPQRVANSQLARLLQASEGDVERLRTAPRYFDGEQPTTAQVLQTPRAVQAEKALSNRPDMKTAFVEQQNANNAGRVGVLRSLAGSDDALDKAVQTRREKARSFASQALAPGAENTRFARAAKGLKEFQEGRNMPMAEFKVVDEARRIAGRVERGTLDEKEAAKLIGALNPRLKATKKALEQAMATIDQNMINPARINKTLGQLALSGNATVRAAAKGHLALLAEHADGSGRVPAYALDDIRQNIGSMLSKNAPNGVVGSQEAALYAPVSSKIVGTLDRAIPGYRDYLASYRADSAPINTMESARRILGPVDQRGLDSSGAGRLTLAQLNAGLNRLDKSRYGMTPEARTQMEGLRQSLRRESVSNSVTSPGSDTAYNLAADGWLARQVYGPTMQGPSKGALGVATALGAAGGSQIGGMIGAGVGAGLGGALKLGADKVNQRIADKVAQGMRDPQEAARMIEAYLQKHPNETPALLKAYPHWAALLGYESAGAVQPR